MCMSVYLFECVCEYVSVYMCMYMSVFVSVGGRQTIFLLCAVLGMEPRDH